MPTIQIAKKLRGCIMHYLLQAFVPESNRTTDTSFLARSQGVNLTSKRSVCSQFILEHIIHFTTVNLVKALSALGLDTRCLVRRNRSDKQ